MSKLDYTDDEKYNRSITLYENSPEGMSKRNFSFTVGPYDSLNRRIKVDLQLVDPTSGKPVNKQLGITLIFKVCGL